MVTNLAYYFETAKKVRGGQWVWVKDGNGEARSNVLLGGTILNPKKGFDHLFAAQLVQYTPQQGCYIFRSFAVKTATSAATDTVIYVKGDGFSDAPETGMILMKAPESLTAETLTADTTTGAVTKTVADVTGQSAVVTAVEYSESDKHFKVTLSVAIGALTTDDILVEAVSPEKARNVSGKRYGWWIAAAACFCLIAGFGAWSLFGSRTAPADPNGSENVAGKVDLDEDSFILDGQQNARYQRFTYEDFIRFGLLPEGTPDSDVYTLAAMCVVSDDSLGATLGTITTASKPELVGKTARQYKTASGDNVCIVESDGGYEFYYRKAILEQ